MIYKNQIYTTSQIINCFTTVFWVILKALLQSGKTNSYLLTAFEMIRLKKSDYIDIFCGCSDVKLKFQLRNDFDNCLDYYLEYLEKEKIEYESLFKISGRYWLNNNFNIDNFINDSYTVKFVENNNLLSNFFKLPKRLVLNFKEYLNTTDIIDYEFKNYFTRFIKSLNDEENKKEIRDKIGVSGFKSMNGKFIDI